MNENFIVKFLGVAFGLFLISLGLTFVITARHTGVPLITQTIVALFHICVEVVLGAIVLVVVLAAINKLQHQVIELAKMVRELAKKMREPARPILAMCVLVAEAVKIVTDKSFEGHNEEGLIVSLILLFAFFIANQWLKDEKNTKSQWIGGSIWFGAIALVPIMVMLVNGWNPEQLLEEIKAHLETGTLVVLGLVLFLLAILPFSFKHLEEG